MARNTGGVEAAGPAYWSTRREAGGLTDMQLRWELRRLRRQLSTGALDLTAQAQLDAYEAEARSRGHEATP